MPNIPASAKKPQDHQAKDDTTVETVDITVGEGDDARTIPAKRVTIRDIEVTVPDEALDDFEVLDDIRAAQDSNDGSRLPSLLRRLVGDDYRKIMDGLRGVNGRVSVADGSQFVLDLFKALNPNS